MISPDLALALTSAASAERILVASDFDGTLSPIVSHPEDAEPEAGAMEALESAAALEGVTVAVISGRAEEVLGFLTGRPAGVFLVGTQGASVDHDPKRVDLIGEVAALTRALRAVEDEYPGTVVEAKATGAALHYGQAEEPMAAAHAASEVGSRFDARVITGRQVVELILSEGTKGPALADQKAAANADVVIFFGDDPTDEEVFTSLSTTDVGVKVGPGQTAARFALQDPASVVEAIEYLVGERRRLR